MSVNQPPIRLGAKVPSSGSLPQEIGISTMALQLEEAGFSSLWCSDHVVMTDRTDGSYYPFSDDGRPTWDPAGPWYDAVVAMSMMAAATTRAQIGVAVLVLPLRHPIVFAKQVASLDRLSGGRVELGVGAGWYREEFEALGVEFAARGRRLDDWITLLRECWTGRPAGTSSSLYALPDGVVCEPRPLGEVPILIGGMSDTAIARAARNGGWLALQRASAVDAAEIARAVRKLRSEAEAVGRDPATLRVVVRIIESAGASDRIARVLAEYADAGVTEIIVDTDWGGEGDAAAVVDRLTHAMVRS